MRFAALAAAAASAFLLGGCQTDTVDCASADAQAVIADILRGQIEKAADGHAEYEGGRIASDAKVRATVAQIKIAIEDVRTTKEDPNSTKRFCAGTARYVLPVNIIDDADRARQDAGLDAVAAMLERVGLERSADAFTHDIEFNVQPTDDGKKVYGEVETLGEAFSVLGEVVAAHLALPTLTAQRQAAEAQAKEQEALEAAQLQAQNEAALEVERAENKLANQSLTEIWRAFGEDGRAQFLEVQRAWIKKKTVDCNLLAAQTSTEPTEKETARLRCDTEATNRRAAELRGYLEG